MENVRTYISEGQLGAVEGRGPVAEERVEISEDAAFEDKTKTAERLADQSPLARGIRQAFMYYGVSIMQTFVEFSVFALAQLALSTGVANGIAVACSGSFNSQHHVQSVEQLLAQRGAVCRPLRLELPVRHLVHRLGGCVVRLP